jgi:lysophospholipase L1-like esterase
MFFLAGGFFVLCALLYNEWLIEAAVLFMRKALNRPWTTIPDAGIVRRMEMAYAALAALLIGCGMLIGASQRLDRFFRRPLVASALLAFFAFFVPAATLEVALRPYAQRLSKDTSLFVKDDALGWRLRPSTTQPWGGISVTTNAKGLRGPEIPYEKTDARRILYLGDSVTFGYMVERWEDTFPYAIEARLEASGMDVETVNSGVGGWSCWQHLVFLEDEGLRYEPDLVVVGFVLNDVTEKFTLVRFGGAEESRQLRESYYSRLDVILTRSALAYQVRNFAREWKAKRVLGSDPKLGAIERQAFDVETLMRYPDRQHIKEAWKLTLENLQRIFDVCAERGIPALLVIHPFAIQLDSPDDLTAPQRHLSGYARANGMAFVDLLPVLRRHLADTGQSAGTLYLDHDHLSIEGHQIVAEILTPRLREMMR